MEGGEETMRSIDIDLEVHRRIEAERCSLEESECAILRRLLGIDGQTEADAEQAAFKPNPPQTIGTALAVGSRTTGQWSVRWENESYLARNLREAYLTALSKIAQHQPRSMDKLASEGSGRRRIVARSARELYPRSPHLADYLRNWHQLGEWYVDLNLSRAQAAKRIRRACAFAGLRYGDRLVIKDGLEAL